MLLSLLVDIAVYLSASIRAAQRPIGPAAEAHMVCAVHEPVNARVPMKFRI